MKTTVKTASISRTTAVEAEIEIEATDGGPGYELIGQPEAQGAATLKAALRAADLDRTLHTNTRITIRPEHPGNEDLHELPITLGLLQLHGKIPADALGDSIVAGAVDRNGELRASRGMYAVARLAGPRHLITAEENEPELIDAGVTDATLAGDIDHMVERLRGEQPPNNASDSSRRHAEDRGFAAIAGWEADKSALEIAVAGRHALLVSGARTCPAIGLMRRAATLWPSPEGAEIEALRRMYSLAGLRLEECTGTNRRPVRAPHFSCSTEAIVGRNSRRSQEGLFGRSLPGEASLAHGGILLITDVEEWKAEQLRAIAACAGLGHATPDGAHGAPARCLVMARLRADGDENPDTTKPGGQADAVGPLFQMRWRMAQKGAVRGTAALARSETGRKHRVEVATRRQRWRYEAELCNGEVDDALFVHRFDLGARLREALDTLGISACGPTARIAATIADLRGDEEPSKQDLAEALAYSTERRGTPTGGAAR